VASRPTTVRAEDTSPGTLTGVLGFPVAHSRSPDMHNAAFRALGLEWRYVRLPVAPERFAETARALPGAGYRGANVTIPHKVAALALADTATAAAQAVGAANTLTFSAAGEVEADNTDAAGFLDALGAESAHGRRALVLGAGGAGRAVAWALREAGAAEVAVWNRTSGRAAALAAQLGIVHAAQPSAADIVVNATAVGLGRHDADQDDAGALIALGLDKIAPPAVVVDLVYGDEPTPVERWGRRAGARVVDGREILVRQGARSFERWTGLRPPLDVMRRALAERSRDR
jgi:shikimate dehydrogenase